MDSPAAVAGEAEIVLTSLPSVEALREVVSGASGLLAGARPGLVVAELSTLPIEAKEVARGALATKGVALLDCPLSGTGAQAATGDLAVYASGDRRAYERASSLFARFARASHYLGEFGNGSRMKFVANLLVAIHNVASAEAIVLGMRAGLDPAAICKVIASGAGSSRIFELRAPLMAAGRYEPPTMKIDIWQKDMAIIGDFAAKLGVATPLFAASAPVYEQAMAQGLGGQDTAAVCAVLEAWSGVPERHSPAMARQEKGREDKR
jgi:3-hydroxyisobutyrate dehydrogenase-like beta-hydroxyacid dehydrogenase